jgi:hypothetical protein
MSNYFEIIVELEMLYENYNIKLIIGPLVSYLEAMKFNEIRFHYYHANEDQILKELVDYIISLQVKKCICSCIIIYKWAWLLFYSIHMFCNTIHMTSVWHN